ncbi:SDR family oxidoreductase [Nonomuraea roseola]|uniref:SDR family oxidoreductase n=1 Tax=Nonomuraea roseola TaxID=46179 RepID=A0ABV5PSA6_9ACTN
MVGGSRGQGAACAELLATRGATTVISYAHGEHAAARTLTALELTDLNTRSAFNTLRAAARHLADHGRYVALTSSCAITPGGCGLYAAAKSAVERLVGAAARELTVREITVNAVAPGPVSDSIYLGTDSSELWPRHPRGRLGQPEDTALVVAWLVSEAAGWISGQTIRADGGLS